MKIDESISGNSDFDQSIYLEQWRFGTLTKYFGKSQNTVHNSLSADFTTILFYLNADVIFLFIFTVLQDFTF